MKEKKMEQPSNGLGMIAEESQEASKKLLEQKPIADTPFTAVKLDNKWFLTLGKYRISELLKSEQECIDAAQDASWARIMQVIQIMILEHEHEMSAKYDARREKTAD